MVAIINPEFADDVVDWCDCTADNLSFFVRPMKIMEASQWREWALHAVQAPKIAALNPPNPLHFVEWATWADRFNQVIATLR